MGREPKTNKPTELSRPQYTHEVRYEAEDGGTGWIRLFGRMERFVCTREEYPFGAICHKCCGRSFAGAFYESDDYLIQLCLRCSKVKKPIQIYWFEYIEEIDEMEVD